MGGVKFADTRTVSRVDLAAWLHDLASQLESGRELSLAEAQEVGPIAVADQTVRDVEIEQDEDGAKTKLEIDIEWTAAGPALAEAAPGAREAGAVQPQALHGDLLEQARQNDDFRRVVATNPHTQVVLMTLPPGGEIGSEVHTNVDQILIGIDGSGTSVLNGVQRGFSRGDVVVVPQGMRHNFVNDGAEPLRLITVYGPPAHRPGTVHHTKADAERDEADIPPPA